MASETNKTAAEWRRAAVVVAAGLLAAAGVVATPTPAAAQHRSNNDGRALDANRRVGSGGQNDGGVGVRGGPMVTGNQIVTGNVTAGRQFRGPVPYSDPGEFRGITAGRFTSDRFVRESAGVPRAFAPEVDQNKPSTYFGSARVLPPPVGYLPTAGATGGYIPGDSAAARPSLDMTRNYTPTLDSTLRARELIMRPPGGQDGAQEGDSTLSASPLYGVRVWRAGESPNDFLAGGREGRAGEGGDRFSPDVRNVMRMRDELNRAGVGNANDEQGVQGQRQDLGQGGIGNDGANGNGAGAGQGGISRPLNQSIGGGNERQQGGGVGTDPLRSSLGSEPMGSSVATGQSIRRNLLIPPERQTPQLARLRRAYDRQQGGNVGDVEAARQFNRELTASRQRPAQAPGAQPGQPGQRGVGAGPGPVGSPPTPGGTKVPPPAEGAQDPATAPGDVAPQQPAKDPAAQPAPPQPEKIESIAEGVEAKGLRDVLKSAEDLMRAQKFAEALNRYEVAQRVAPNNALISMGRANAELGASFYRRAESSLRDAVSRAPELVVAQFDLRALVGEERLQVLVKDLKQLAAEDPKAVRPPLLLAYIAYNTGNEEQAGEYLASAEQAVGPDDPLLRAWRSNWKLTGTPSNDAAAEPGAQPDLNK